MTDSVLIVVGIFLIIVFVFSAVEQRRAAKKYAANETAYRDALAENRELLELQREAAKQHAANETAYKGTLAQNRELLEL